MGAEVVYDTLIGRYKTLLHETDLVRELIGVTYEDIRAANNEAACTKPGEYINIYNAPALLSYVKNNENWTINEGNARTQDFTQDMCENPEHTWEATGETQRYDFESLDGQLKLKMCGFCVEDECWDGFAVYPDWNNDPNVMWDAIKVHGAECQHTDTYPLLPKLETLQFPVKLAKRMKPCFENEDLFTGNTQEEMRNNKTDHICVCNYKKEGVTGNKHIQ